MTVRIYDAATDKTEVYTGSLPQVENQLDAVYTFLKKYDPKHLVEKLHLLARQQNLFVEVDYQ